LILVPDNKSYIVSKRFWAYAQYSRTIRPGAVRLGTTGGNLKVTAFQNVDKSIAVNVLSSASAATTVSVAIAGYNVTTAKSWITDNNHDMDAQTATIGSDGSVTGSVPARGMLSFVIKSGGS
jgi:O-glycosyl hydrolase